MKSKMASVLGIYHGEHYAFWVLSHPMTDAPRLYTVRRVGFDERGRYESLTVAGNPFSNEPLITNAKTAKSIAKRLAKAKLSRPKCSEV